MYQCVFVCLGIYDDNHILTDSEGQALADYLNHEGRVYMEGGDTWFYDDTTPVHSMFKINGTHDGSGDLGIIFGQEGSFAEGLTYPYNGDNSYIDRIEPTGNAFELFHNQIPSYCNAVALDEGTYKTVGCSFEFGGLNDNQNTKEELMILILEFFGGILTDVEEPAIVENINLNAWPNPFSENINFTFTLDDPTHVSLEIFSLNGKKINSIVNGKLNDGEHHFSWDGSTSQGERVPEGMFIYILKTGKSQQAGKVIITH